jgi:hypothetical protein
VTKGQIRRCGGAGGPPELHPSTTPWKTKRQPTTKGTFDSSSGENAPALIQMRRFMKVFPDPSIIGRDLQWDERSILYIKREALSKVFSGNKEYIVCFLPTGEGGR